MGPSAASSQLLHGTSRLALKSGVLRGATRALLVDPPPEDAAALSRAVEPAAAVSFFAVHSRERAGIGTDGPALTTRDHDVVMVFHPKGTRRRDYALAQASQALVEGGTLAIVGTKREGIMAVRKRFDVRAQRYGDHAKLFIVEPAHNAMESLKSWEVVWDTGLGFDAISYPGTFAEGRLDGGTKLLLETLGTASLPTSGRLLDLACGSGVLGIAAKRQRPALEVHLADADHLAVAASRRTAEESCAEVTVYASNGVATVPGDFDVILLNPPFHEGVATSEDASAELIRGAAGRLRPGGVLWVVANEFLSHENVLDTVQLSHRRVAANGRFKVLRAQN